MLENTLKEEVVGEKPLFTTFRTMVDRLDLLTEKLKDDPSFINKQDEHGMTLMHHAAHIGAMGSYHSSPILKLLFATPNLDLSIKDNNGNTAVHVAALLSRDRVSCKFIFPYFVREAAARNFDFASKGQGGKTVLHLATLVSYTDPRGIFGRYNNVKNVLDNCQNPEVNLFSDSGATAFWYAVNHAYFAEAHALLDAGADPFLTSIPGRDPGAMLCEHLQFFQNARSQEKYADEIEKINYLLEKFTILAERMEKIRLEKNTMAENTSARITFFSRGINEPEDYLADCCPGVWPQSVS